MSETTGQAAVAETTEGTEVVVINVRDVGGTYRAKAVGRRELATILLSLARGRRRAGQRKAVANG